MASIRKVSTGWLARWRTPEGESRCKTFDRKLDAERFLTTVESSKLSGAYVDPGTGKVAFKEYAEQWRAVQVHRSGTASQIETNLRLHVYPRIGSRPMASIRRSEIQALIKALDGELAPATVVLIYRWVVSIFRSALADRVIAETPCREIKLPNVDKPKVVPLSVETVEALIEAVPARYGALVVLGAGTGVRISEALGLTNDRVDWMRSRSVTIDRQMLRDAVVGPSSVPSRTGRTASAPSHFPRPCWPPWSSTSGSSVWARTG
ncbi:MAG TPA: hypothetical protein VHT75_04840 [Acidimicrobiales bacterium]|nr:hypothetical protein [Acidimicrobiales bacterium]